MRRYLGWFLNGFAITFAVPSFLIIISWSALPGDRLYGIKTGLEDVALGITIKTPLASILSVKYTERRFSEANTLLSKKASTVGYKLLVEETQQSRKIIVDKKDKSRASELVVKIEEYQKEITQKKIAIETNQISLPVAYQPPTPPQTYPTNAPVVQPTIPPTTPTEVPTPQTEEEIIDDLEETEKKLEEIKEDLKKNVPTSIQPQSQPQEFTAGEHRKQNQDQEEDKTLEQTPQNQYNIGQ